ncbi:MAG: DUF2793 domain-containing protein [Sphingomonas sp.]|jgi:hypothetical protein|uniref:DUF2793 domain-containing protein n=1 Tax=unclassified Sphingomonas TaxID=196159 RepID=UPI00053EF678|nr:MULTISPECIES: DUF2793 domain-containing protein [unclassified Sphingomonas]MDR6848482.1 hypothetical protein [Sphingomonas sp. BE137]MDR7259144.1 hypothetical protein [Sphingomonas sp. BE270]
MNDQTTVRLSLPLLQVGQAQKELSHNEALTLLDFAVQPVVEAVGVGSPPVSPDTGACWIVGPSPTGAWSGSPNAIAGWTNAGWRFLAARDGMNAWSRGDSAFARFDGSRWRIGEVTGACLLVAGRQVVGEQQSAISAATGGTTIDAEARATLAAVLAAMRSHGLIAS